MREERVSERETRKKRKRKFCLHLPDDVTAGSLGPSVWAGAHERRKARGIGGMASDGG